MLILRSNMLRKSFLCCCCCLGVFGTYLCVKVVHHKRTVSNLLEFAEHKIIIYNFTVSKTEGLSKWMFMVLTELCRYTTVKKLKHFLLVYFNFNFNFNNLLFQSTNIHSRNIIVMVSQHNHAWQIYQGFYINAVTNMIGSI